MILHVFSVFDNTVEAFEKPWFGRSRGEGVRIFFDACRAQDSPFNAHPKDFVLFCVGTFDTNSGRFTSIDPDRVLTAEDALARSDQ